jgi:hypothetical protein
VLLAKETTLKATNFNKLYLSTYSFYYNSLVFYWSYLVYLIPVSAAFLWIWGFLLYGTQKCSLGQHVIEKQETDHRKICHGYWVHYYQ